MKNQKFISAEAKNYKKIGLIAAAVIVVAALGIWGVRNFTGSPISVDSAIADVSSDAMNGANLRFAIVRMDAIQMESKALTDLRKQRESYETKLRDELTSRQKALEKEKTEIEKSQDVLSREALQKRVAEYQQKVAGLQQDLTTRAQAIDASFQKALARIQAEDLDPIVDGIIEKKNLSVVIDGRFARTSGSVNNLDITEDIVKALDKRVPSAKMEKPKGF
jgi:Skp family chaperone for outer membrane proteins